MEGPAATDDGDVAHGGAAEDLEHGFRDIAPLEDRERGEQHACDVQRDVSLANDGDMFSLVQRWGRGTRWVMGVPVDER